MEEARGSRKFGRGAKADEWIQGFMLETPEFGLLLNHPGYPTSYLVGEASCSGMQMELVQSEPSLLGF